MSDRKEESRKYYLKKRERILAYQRKRRIEKKAELKAKRDKKKLEKQVYDFNRNFDRDMITVAEWEVILKGTLNCPGCGIQFYVDSFRTAGLKSMNNPGGFSDPISHKPTLQYDPDEHRVIPVCQECINPFIRGRIGGGEEGSDL